MRGLVQAAYEEAKKTLTENLDELHIVADALLKHETLSAEEMRQSIVDHKALKLPTPNPSLRIRNSETKEPTKPSETTLAIA